MFFGLVLDYLFYTTNTQCELPFMISSQTPKISVIVPCYNVALQVEDLLKCLSTQDFDEPWEILFVNNRSTDDSVSVIETFQGELPPYQILSAPDTAGAGYARNVGVKSAQASLVAFCDADDEIPNDWVRKMYLAITEFGFVGCRIGERKGTAKKFSGLMNDDIGGFYNIGYLPFSGAGTLGIRKDIFDEVGGFDNHLRICEDIDLCYRVQLSGHPLHADPTNKIFYRAPETEWAIYKQRFLWGRYEKVMARRYKRFGHSQEGVPGGPFKALVKCGIIYLLRCYDQQKRLRYGKMVCKSLAELLPARMEAKLPVIISESQLDPSVIARFSDEKVIEFKESA